MDDAQSEPVPDDRRVDVVQYASGEVKAVPGGKGADIAASQGRSRPLHRDRVVLGAAGVATVLSTLLAVLAVGYSLLILRAILLGLFVSLVVFAVGAFAVGGVAALRWQRSGDAALLEEGVILRDAREQWDATPVSAVESPEERDREREHAYE